MFPPHPQRVRLVEDLDGYVKVYDTADWRIVLDSLEDALGNPLDLSAVDLHMQIRPVNLPNLVVDDLRIGSGISIDGSSVTIVSSATNRSWRARENTVLVADLMMEQGADDSVSVTFLTRIHLTVEPGFTTLGVGDP